MGDIISRRDGFSDDELRRMQRSGEIRRLMWGRFIRCGDVPPTELDEHRSLVLAARDSVSPDAVVSYISAAVVHGCDVWKAPLTRAHFTRNRPNGASRGKAVVVHSGKVEGADLMMVDGVVVTSVARTIVDIARTESFENAVVVGDSALRQGLTTSAAIRDCLARCARVPGARTAQRVVDFLDGRSENTGESLCRLALRDAGLGVPELQPDIFTTSGRWVARVDFLFPEHGLIGEFDGTGKYRKELRGNRSADSVVIDEKVREDRLRALGWMVVRWIWDELALPGRIVERARTAAQLATPHRQSGFWRPRAKP